MIETISLIVAGVLSGLAAHKANRAEKQTSPNGTNRTLVELVEGIDQKVDEVVMWQAKHDVRHTYLNPDDPWLPRTADE